MDLRLHVYLRNPRICSRTQLALDHLSNFEISNITSICSILKRSLINFVDYRYFVIIINIKNGLCDILTNVHIYHFVRNHYLVSKSFYS